MGLIVLALAVVTAYAVLMTVLYYDRREQIEHLRNVCRDRWKMIEDLEVKLWGGKE